MRLDIQKYVDELFPKVKESSRNANMKQFSYAMGMSENAVSKLYDGITTNISFDTLESLCRVLNCTPNDILISDEISYLKYYNKNNEPISISIDITGDSTKEDIIYAVQQLQSTFSDVVDNTQKQIDELMKLIPQTAKDTNTDT